MPDERPPVTITERDRLAILGGVEIIRLYQRTIDETTRLIASMLQVEPEGDYSYAYYGVLTDEITDDRQSGQTTVNNLLRHYNVAVTEDLREDHAQRQQREADTR